MFDDVMALQDADGYFSADAMEGLREMVAAGDAAAAAEEAKARSVAQREAAKAANRAAKVEAKTQRAAANAAGRAAARAGRFAKLPYREEPAPLVDEDAPMGGVFEPIANGTLVTVCAYPDAGVQRWENHAFVGRVFDYDAADDGYIVRGLVGEGEAPAGAGLARAAARTLVRRLRQDARLVRAGDKDAAEAHGERRGEKAGTRARRESACECHKGHGRRHRGPQGRRPRRRSGGKRREATAAANSRATTSASTSNVSSQRATRSSTR